MTDSQHRARKDFGQHFLTDQNVIGNIVRAINPKPTDTMVEIGPGLGALTAAILPHTKKLDAIEIDTDVLEPLQHNCADLGQLTIHNQDVLTFDFTQYQTPIRLIGNLPYNISSPLIFHVLDALDHILDMHFMLQKEVVDRMCGTPGNKNYGRLSVMVQYFCQVDSLFTVKPGSFNPPPKVNSAIVRLTPRPVSERNANSTQRLSKVVKAAFSMRRKTLRNNLKGIIRAEQLVEIGIDPGARAETLSVQEFVHIANLGG